MFLWEHKEQQEPRSTQRKVSFYMPFLLVLLAVNYASDPGFQEDNRIKVQDQAKTQAGGS